MGKTGISWCDTTWNPVTGCSKVSPGCANCYAETVTQRYAGRPGWPAEFLPWTPENAEQNVVLHPERLDVPLHWRKPRRVFVNSMSDLFHEQVPDEFIDRVFAVMALAPWHTFQVLTKRPERMRGYLSDVHHGCGGINVITRIAIAAGEVVPSVLRANWPLKNVWLGVSIENQHWADARIPVLLQTPAAVRFISAEPLLGPVDARAWVLQKPMKPVGEPIDRDVPHLRNITGWQSALVIPGLDWVIVGGESGPKRRDMDLDWLRSLRDQCQAAGVAFHLKQLGGRRPGGAALLDGREWREFPEMEREIVKVRTE